MNTAKILTSLAICSTLLSLATLPVEAREVILRQSQHYNSSSPGYDNYYYDNYYYYDNSYPVPSTNRSRSVYSPNHSYPYNLRSGTRIRHGRIDDSTLINPTIINSNISDSVLINPVIVNPHQRHRHDYNQGSYIYYGSPGTFQIRVGY